MSEQRLACAVCGREFTFTAEEQAFFREQGFTRRSGARHGRGLTGMEYFKAVMY